MLMLLPCLGKILSVSFITDNRPQQCVHVSTKEVVCTYAC